MPVVIAAPARMRRKLNDCVVVRTAFWPSVRVDHGFRPDGGGRVDGEVVVCDGEVVVCDGGDVVIARREWVFKTSEGWRRKRYGPAKDRGSGGRGAAERGARSRRTMAAMPESRCRWQGGSGVEGLAGKESIGTAGELEKCSRDLAGVFSRSALYQLWPGTGLDGEVVTAERSVRSGVSTAGFVSGELGSSRRTRNLDDIPVGFASCGTAKGEQRKDPWGDEQSAAARRLKIEILLEEEKRTARDVVIS